MTCLLKTKLEGRGGKSWLNLTGLFTLTSLWLWRVFVPWKTWCFLCTFSCSGGIETKVISTQGRCPEHELFAATFRRTPWKSTIPWPSWHSEWLLFLSLPCCWWATLTQWLGNSSHFLPAGWATLTQQMFIHKYLYIFRYIYNLGQYLCIERYFYIQTYTWNAIKLLFIHVNIIVEFVLILFKQEHWREHWRGICVWSLQSCF